MTIITPFILGVFIVVAVAGLIIYLRQSASTTSAPELASISDGIAVWVHSDSGLLRSPLPLDEKGWQSVAERIKRQEPWLRDCIFNAIAIIERQEALYVLCLFEKQIRQGLFQRIESLKYALVWLIALSRPAGTDLERYRDRVARQLEVFAASTTEDEPDRQHLRELTRQSANTYGLPWPSRMYLPDGYDEMPPL